jgi:hypothetical protein
MLTKDGKLQVRLVPAITQKLLRENEEFQQRIRQGLNTAPVHPALHARARSILQAEETKKIMLGLFAVRRQAKRSENLERVVEIEAQISRLGNKLSKHLFDAGEFNLAAKATSDKKQRAKVLAYQKALEIDDSAHCHHQKWFSHDGKRHPNYFRERDIFSVKHNAVVAVVRCNECEFRNIRPLPEDLAEMSRIRAEAVKKARR